MKPSKSEAIAFSLAALFVVGIGSVFALAIVHLIGLFNRALPALMQGQAQVWMPR